MRGRCVKIVANASRSDQEGLVVQNAPQTPVNANKALN